MSKINESRSNDISLLFIDLEITTEELNTVQSALEGRQGIGCGSVVSHCKSLY